MKELTDIFMYQALNGILIFSLRIGENINHKTFSWMTKHIPRVSFDARVESFGSDQ